jgi:hypothetical protein
MESAQKRFGTVNLRFTVPDPKRCHGCLELLAEIGHRRQLRGKIHTAPNSTVIRYRKRSTSVRCTICNTVFKHTFYEVVQPEDDDGVGDG